MLLIQEQAPETQGCLPHRPLKIHARVGMAFYPFLSLCSAFRSAGLSPAMPVFLSPSSGFLLVESSRNFRSLSSCTVLSVIKPCVTLLLLSSLWLPFATFSPLVAMTTIGLGHFATDTVHRTQK